MYMYIEYKYMYQFLFFMLKNIFSEPYHVLSR